MKKISKLLFALMVLLMVLFFAGCIYIENYNPDRKLIYGDDARIAEEGDSYTTSQYSWTQSGNTLEMNFAGFTGSMTKCAALSGADGAAKISFESVVDAGKCKLVAVLPGGEVQTVFEGTEQSEKQLTLPGGKTRLKLVGDGAKGKVFITLEGSDNTEIVFYKD